MTLKNPKNFPCFLVVKIFGRTTNRSMGQIRMSYASYMKQSLVCLTMNYLEDMKVKEEDIVT